MTLEQVLHEISSLTPSEQLKIAQVIWDRLPDDFGTDPSRGQSGSLSSLPTLGESSGPSLHAVIPCFTGTMTTSDSLFGVVTAISGLTLMRLPTSFEFEELNCRTEQGLSGYLVGLFARATALYTVSSRRSNSR